ncbi:hypothetical protein [Pseudomonas fulva]|uniref:hypothetical protein n=1 Tax=Pseudomonas fulva TaxID=47880 RepID=UPI003461D0C2
MRHLTWAALVISTSVCAASLEDEVKGAKTVDQLYQSATEDITTNALLKYRDNLRIEPQTLELISTTSKTADVKVSYTWSVPEHTLEEIKDTLGKYFLTTLHDNKITVGLYNCHGHMGSDYCIIKDRLARFLETKSVGTEVTLLGVKDIFSYNHRGIEYAKTSTYSVILTVDKSRIKGTPSPKFSSHIYNIRGCTPFIPECNIQGVYRK